MCQQRHFQLASKPYHIDYSMKYELATSVTHNKLWSREGLGKAQPTERTLLLNLTCSYPNRLTQ